jgi:hypothetical protein
MRKTDDVLVKLWDDTKWLQLIHNWVMFERRVGFPEVRYSICLLFGELGT